jgi:hypothetical protein
MNNGRRATGMVVGVALALISMTAGADGFLSDAFSNIDVSVGGFIRQETAFREADEENPINQGGNVFQNRKVSRQAYLPPTFTGLNLLGITVPPLTSWSTLPIPATPLTSDASSSVLRSNFVHTDSNQVNYVILRGETELGIKFGEHLSLVGRLRAVYQPSVYDEFNATSVANEQGGITGGDARLYHGKPDFYDYIVEGGKKPNPLEWTGTNYQIYFPALILDYHQGGLDLRVGNQQIAWGQAIFLRVFDTPDGLDLRRHLLLDRGLEEFSDIRVPAPTVRLTYQLTDTILMDSFVSKFQPSVYGNPNTPYNVIPTQFTVHDLYAQDGTDRWTTLNGGIRFKADYGRFGWQASFVRRYNPDGVFRWTESGVNKPLQGGVGTVGALVNTLYSLKVPGCAPAVYNPSLCRNYGSIGEALSHTPFEASPGGVYSANEWYNYAAQVRLNGQGGLNAAINDFPASRDVYATAVPNYQDGFNELNTFFIASGGSLRGHIAREYFQENDFALGGSYVNESENDFLNELIFNVEVQYTPKRTFTAVDLNTSFHKEDEYTVSLVVDKWHRFFNNFPGTYIVAEAYTRQRADLVGRLLKGYDGSEGESATGKHGNANYLVAGFLQPFPNKIWAIEFASLYDVAGGILVQPGLQWNPGHHITVEGYYNFVDGNLYGASNPNDNLISTLNFSREAFVRLTYAFSH